VNVSREIFWAMTMDIVFVSLTSSKTLGGFETIIGEWRVGSRNSELGSASHRCAGLEHIYTILIRLSIGKVCHSARIWLLVECGMQRGSAVKFGYRSTQYRVGSRAAGSEFTPHNDAEQARFLSTTGPTPINFRFFLDFGANALHFGRFSIKVEVATLDEQQRWRELDALLGRIDRVPTKRTSKRHGRLLLN
jgi:hypothetical protein